MSRLAWLVVLAPLACFSEGDVESSDGDSTQGDTTNASASATTSASTTSSSDESTSSTTSADDVTSATTTTTSTATTSSDESEDTATTDTGDACEDGFVPLPDDLPPGWDGVFTLSPPSIGEGTPMCPTGMVDHDVVLADITALPCTCDCDPGCWVYTELSADCTDPDDILDPVHDEECTSSPLAPVRIDVDHDLAEIGGCETPMPSPVLDGTDHRVCEHTDGTPCVPAPPEFLAPCVRHDGDVPCPAGPFSQKVLTAESLDVFCDPCESCHEAAVTACESATGLLYPEPDCMGTAAVVTNLQCSPETGASLVLDLELACPTSGAAPGAPVSERTYCCVP
ncbi:MAG TPA: hypothetical protein VG755_02740 [Nannocystaceae bacterium]|nr:hypothetical protein [Nannocystaceae bacterium]